MEYGNDSKENQEIHRERTGNDRPTMRKRIGFDKLKVKCYNYEEFGHFTKEFDKLKREYPQNNKNQDRNPNFQKKNKTMAVVVQEGFDWSMKLLGE